VQLREREEQLDEAKSGNQSLKQHLTKVETLHSDSLGAAAKKIDTLTAKLLDVQEETEHLILARQERDSVASENSQLVDQLLSAQEELEQRFSSYAKLGHEKGALETRLAELSGQVKSLEQKLELKRKQLEVIHASASWKAAAPARLLTRPFKKKTNEQRSTQQQIALVRASELFDADWYLATYPDVANSGISPEEHFVRYGGFENRLPGPAFNTSVYFSRYPDVSEAGMNPLVHYLKFGAEEQREIN
jgi:chromosome segregation ATPase